MDQENCKSHQFSNEAQTSESKLWEEWQQLALSVATAAHEGQVDKAGQPYIGHPLAVASMVVKPEQKVVALLHDVLEDTEVTEADLRNCGFPDFIIEALRLLTRAPGEEYFSYVMKIRDNDLAKAVKLADLTHNMDLGRLPQITEKDRLRLEKYERAKALLLE